MHLFILCRPLALHVGEQVGQRCGIKVAAGREEDAAVDSKLEFLFLFSSIICPVTVPTMKFSAALKAAIHACAQLAATRAPDARCS
jgi:hypothetical protein